MGVPRSRVYAGPGYTWDAGIIPFQLECSFAGHVSRLISCGGRQKAVPAGAMGPLLGARLLRTSAPLTLWVSLCSAADGSDFFAGDRLSKHEMPSITINSAPFSPLPATTAKLLIKNREFFT